MKKVVKRSSVLIIYCGGITHLKGKALDAWLAEMSELAIVADTRVEVFFAEPTADIKPTHWMGLANIIHANHDRYDGFVVLHGMDNILYTSSALSMLLRNLDKPVVFTGGYAMPSVRKPYLGSGREAGIKANIINAVQAATFHIPEVVLLFGNRLVRANVARYASATSPVLFESPDLGVLGRIDFSIRLNEKNILPRPAGPLALQSLEESVVTMTVSPLPVWETLEKSLSNFKGVVVNTAHLEVLPGAVIALVGRLSESVVVAVRTKAPLDSDLLKKIIPLSGYTKETGMIKFMWALKQSNQLAKIRELMDTSIAGEQI